MRALLIGLVVLALVALVATFSEPLAPTARVDGLGTALGRGTPLRVTATDRGSGLARVEVRLVPGDGSEPLVLARQEFPRTGLFGSGVHEATLTPTWAPTSPSQRARRRSWSTRPTIPGCPPCGARRASRSRSWSTSRHRR